MAEVVNKRLLALVLLSISLFLISGCIYTAFLHSIFQLDDDPNLSGLAYVHNATSALRYILDGTAGVRWISYTSFVPHAEAWREGIAYPFKLGNLSIHFINAVLVFFCLQRLLRLSELTKNIASSDKPQLIFIVSLLSAALWFAHPVHVNTVLYAVQRMTLLAATFSLLGLLFHFWFFARFNTGEKLSFFTWFFYSVCLAVITVLGILGKENAVLIPAFCLLIAIYSGDLKRLHTWQWLLTYIAPFILLVAYLIYSHRLGFGGRNFDMFERLLSQVVILKEYLLKLLLPNSYSFSLYYDGFKPVRSIFEPRFIYAAVFWLGLLFFTVVKRRALPALAFGLAWFLIGQSLEGSIIPLELYFDHRNYFPAIGVMLAGVLLSWQLLSFLAHRGKKLLSYCVAAVLLLLVANMLWISYFNASLWQNKATFEKTQMLMRPDSLRAKQGYMETLFAHGKVAEAAVLLDRINHQYGVQATHLVFEIYALCNLGLGNSINYNKVLKDLTATPFDMGIDSAMKSIFDILLQEKGKIDECPSMNWAMFRRYSHALLNNPRMGRHYHNFAWLLVQSEIQEKHYKKALDESFVLSEGRRSQQYWFLQIRLAIFIQDKIRAEKLYQAMLKSKQVHFKLYKDEIAEMQVKIQALPSSPDAAQKESLK